MLNKKSLRIGFAGEKLIFTAQGAIYWPSKRVLIIADLHLEKGSYFAHKGNPLPLYDTFDTLQRLQDLINNYQPEYIISLGDNIHDMGAFIRMRTADHHQLQTLVESVKEWIWLIGNHDPQTIPPLPEKLSCYSQYDLEKITFSHNFLKDKPYQIVGHYHPKIKVKTISGKCFLINNEKIIMPSFGSYTGGFDIRSQHFIKSVPNEIFKVYLLHREKIWRVS